MLYLTWNKMIPITAAVLLAIFSSNAYAGHDPLVVGKSYTTSHIAVCDSSQSLPKLMVFIQDFPGSLTLSGAEKLAEASGCSFKRQLFTIRENVCSFVRNGIFAFSVVKVDIYADSQASGTKHYAVVNMVPSDMMMKCNVETLNDLPNIE